MINKTNNWVEFTTETGLKAKYLIMGESFIFFLLILINIALAKN